MIIPEISKFSISFQSDISSKAKMPTSTGNGKKIPAFAGKMKFPTGDIRSHERIKKVYFNVQCKTDFLKKSFSNKTVPIWNELPDKLKIGKCTYITTKNKLKIRKNTYITTKNFLNKQVSEKDHFEYGKKCWSEYRFR